MPKQLPVRPLLSRAGACAAIAALGLLAGCGYKGSLYMPPPPQAPDATLTAPPQTTPVPSPAAPASTVPLDSIRAKP
ncbi:MAG: lipoprotein [Burkholderiaceae bacterium]